MLTEEQVKPAEEHIASITPQEVERYGRYLNEHVKPKTVEDKFLRFIFSFASVHTTWRSNIRMYKALEKLDWLHNEQALKDRIIESGAGLHNNRTRFVHAFSEFFWDHPEWFTKSNYETWTAYRDRIVKRVNGLGFAKAAFTLEMLQPTECKVLCTDVHVIKLYGLNPGKIKIRDLYEIEKHWVDTCNRSNVPPTVARWNWWDKNLNQGDSRFWSWVFEKENYNERLAAFTQKPVTI